MKLVELLARYKESETGLLINLGEKLSLNCRILEIYDDFFLVNLLSFDKMEQAYLPTASKYFVPINSILFIEQHKI